MPRVFFCQKCGKPRAFDLKNPFCIGPCGQCGSWSFGAMEPARILPEFTRELTKTDREFLRALAIKAE